MISRPVLQLAAVVVACSFLPGCASDSEPERIAVSGKIVTAAGGPVDGSISFLPELGTDGPAATASIVKGQYGFDRTNGPVAGKYQVIIKPRAAAQKPGSGPSGNANPLTHKAGNAPPEQLFNAEVSADQDQFDFNLK